MQIEYKLKYVYLSYDAKTKTVILFVFFFSFFFIIIFEKKKVSKYVLVVLFTNAEETQKKVEI